MKPYALTFLFLAIVSVTQSGAYEIISSTNVQCLSRDIASVELVIRNSSSTKFNFTLKNENSQELLAVCKTKNKSLKKQFLTNEKMLEELNETVKDNKKDINEFEYITLKEPYIEANCFFPAPKEEGTFKYISKNNSNDKINKNFSLNITPCSSLKEKSRPILIKDEFIPTRHLEIGKRPEQEKYFVVINDENIIKFLEFWFLIYDDTNEYDFESNYNFDSNLIFQFSYLHPPNNEKGEIVYIYQGIEKITVNDKKTGKNVVSEYKKKDNKYEVILNDDSKYSFLEDIVYDKKKRSLTWTIEAEIIKDNVDISKNFIEALSRFSNTKRNIKKIDVHFVCYYDKDGYSISDECTKYTSYQSGDETIEYRKYSYTFEENNNIDIVLEIVVNSDDLDKDEERKIKYIYIEEKQLEDDNFFPVVMRKIDVDFMNDLKSDYDLTNYTKTISLIEKQKYTDRIRYLMKKDNKVYSKVNFYDKFGKLRISCAGGSKNIFNDAEGGISFPEISFFEVYDENEVLDWGVFADDIVYIFLGGKLQIIFRYNENGIPEFYKAKSDLSKKLKIISIISVFLIFGIIVLNLIGFLIYKLYRRLIYKKNITLGKSSFEDEEILRERYLQESSILGNTQSSLADLKIKESSLNPMHNYDRHKLIRADTYNQICHFELLNTGNKNVFDFRCIITQENPNDKILCENFFFLADILDNKANQYNILEKISIISKILSFIEVESPFSNFSLKNNLKDKPEIKKKKTKNIHILFIRNIVNKKTLIKNPLENINVQIKKNLINSIKKYEDKDDFEFGRKVSKSILTSDNIYYDYEVDLKSKFKKKYDEMHTKITLLYIIKITLKNITLLYNSPNKYMIKMYKQEGNIKRGKLKQEQIKEFQDKILNEIDLFSIYKNKITGNYTTPFLERFRNIYRTTLIYDYDKTNLIGNVIDGIFDKVYLYFFSIILNSPSIIDTLINWVETDTLLLEKFKNFLKIITFLKKNSISNRGDYKLNYKKMVGLQYEEQFDGTFPLTDEETERFFKALFKYNIDITEINLGNEFLINIAFENIKVEENEYQLKIRLEKKPLSFGDLISDFSLLENTDISFCEDIKKILNNNISGEEKGKEIKKLIIEYRKYNLHLVSNNIDSFLISDDNEVYNAFNNFIPDYENIINNNKIGQGRKRKDSLLSLLDKELVKINEKQHLKKLEENNIFFIMIEKTRHIFLGIAYNFHIFSLLIICFFLYFVLATKMSWLVFWIILGIFIFISLLIRVVYKFIDKSGYYYDGKITPYKLARGLIALFGSILAGAIGYFISPVIGYDDILALFAIFVLFLLFLYIFNSFGSWVTRIKTSRESNRVKLKKVLKTKDKHIRAERLNSIFTIKHLNHLYAKDNGEFIPLYSSINGVMGIMSQLFVWAINPRFWGFKGWIHLILSCILPFLIIFGGILSLIIIFDLTTPLTVTFGFLFTVIYIDIVRMFLFKTHKHNNLTFFETIFYGIPVLGFLLKILYDFFRAIYYNIKNIGKIRHPRQFQRDSFLDLYVYRYGGIMSLIALFFGFPGEIIYNYLAIESGNLKEEKIENYIFRTEYLFKKIIMTTFIFNYILVALIVIIIISNGISTYKLGSLFILIIIILVNIYLSIPTFHNLYSSIAIGENKEKNNFLHKLIKAFNRILMLLVIIFGLIAFTFCQSVPVFFVFLGGIFATLALQTFFDFLRIKSFFIYKKLLFFFLYVLSGGVVGVCLGFFLNHYNYLKKYSFWKSFTFPIIICSGISMIFGIIVLIKAYIDDNESYIKNHKVYIFQDILNYMKELLTDLKNKHTYLSYMDQDKKNHFFRRLNFYNNICYRMIFALEFQIKLDHVSQIDANKIRKVFNPIKNNNKLGLINQFKSQINYLESNDINTYEFKSDSIARDFIRVMNETSNVDLTSPYYFISRYKLYNLILDIDSENNNEESYIDKCLYNLKKIKRELPAFTNVQLITSELFYKSFYQLYVKREKDVESNISQILIEGRQESNCERYQELVDELFNKEEYDTNIQKARKLLSIEKAREGLTPEEIDFLEYNFLDKVNIISKFANGLNPLGFRPINEMLESKRTYYKNIFSYELIGMPYNEYEQWINIGFETNKQKQEIKELFNSLNEEKFQYLLKVSDGARGNLTKNMKFLKSAFLELLENIYGTIIRKTIYYKVVENIKFSENKEFICHIGYDDNNEIISKIEVPNSGQFFYLITSILSKSNLLFDKGNFKFDSFDENIILKKGRYLDNGVVISNALEIIVQYGLSNKFQKHFDLHKQDDLNKKDLNENYSTEMFILIKIIAEIIRNNQFEGLRNQVCFKKKINEINKSDSFKNNIVNDICEELKVIKNEKNTCRNFYYNILPDISNLLLDEDKNVSTEEIINSINDYETKAYTSFNKVLYNNQNTDYINEYLNLVKKNANIKEAQKASEEKNWITFKTELIKVQEQVYENIKFAKQYIINNHDKNYIIRGNNYSKFISIITNINPRYKKNNNNMNKEIDLLGENADNCKKTLLNTLNEVIKDVEKSKKIFNEAMEGETTFAESSYWMGFIELEYFRDEYSDKNNFRFRSGKDLKIVYLTDFGTGRNVNPSKQQDMNSILKYMNSNSECLAQSDNDSEFVSCTILEMQKSAIFLKDNGPIEGDRGFACVVPIVESLNYGTGVTTALWLAETAGNNLNYTTLILAYFWGKGMFNVEILRSEGGEGVGEIVAEDQPNGERLEEKYLIGYGLYKIQEGTEFTTELVAIPWRKYPRALIELMTIASIIYGNTMMNPYVPWTSKMHTLMLGMGYLNAPLAVFAILLSVFFGLLFTSLQAYLVLPTSFVTFAWFLPEVINLVGIEVYKDKYGYFMGYIYWLSDFFSNLFFFGPNIVDSAIGVLDGTKGHAVFNLRGTSQNIEQKNWDFIAKNNPSIRLGTLLLPLVLIIFNPLTFIGFCLPILTLITWALGPFLFNPTKRVSDKFRDALKGSTMVFLTIPIFIFRLFTRLIIDPLVEAFGGTRYTNSFLYWFGHEEKMNENGIIDSYYYHEPPKERIYEEYFNLKTSKTNDLINLYQRRRRLIFANFVILLVLGILCLAAFIVFNCINKLRIKTILFVFASLFIFLTGFAWFFKEKDNKLNAKIDNFKKDNENINKEMNNYVELKEKLNGINHNINNTNANKTNEVRQLNNNNKQVNQPKTRNIIDIFLNNFFLTLLAGIILLAGGITLLILHVDFPFLLEYIAGFIILLGILLIILSILILFENHPLIGLIVIYFIGIIFFALLGITFLNAIKKSKHEIISSLVKYRFLFTLLGLIIISIAIYCTSKMINNKKKEQPGLRYDLTEKFNFVPKKLNIEDNI